MKSIKYLVILVCMTLGLVNVAKAQIYSNEICFYSEAGNSDVKYVVKFEYSRVLLYYVEHSTVKFNLAKSNDYYENDKNDVWIKYGRWYEYDAYKSASHNKEIYKIKDNRVVNSAWSIMPTYIDGYRYVAFSSDMSSFIKWFEDSKNYDGVIKEKKVYTRIPKEDLLPKATNYDFLND